MTKTDKRPTLEQAKAKYVHRFTMEHIPEWARKPVEPGKFYAPQYRSDAEWYAHTVFPGEPEYVAMFGRARSHCYTKEATWPLGHWLDRPYGVQS